MSARKSRIRAIEQLVETKRHAEAERAALAIIKAEGESEAVVNLVALALRKQGKYLQSAQWFEKSLRANPNQFKPLTEQAQNWAALGQKERALALVSRACDLSPDTFAALVRIAQAYARIEEHAEAVRYYARAGRMQPRNAEVLFRLGRSLRKAGSRLKALEALEAAVEINPSHVGARVELAGALFSIENPQGALEQCEAALAIKPDDVPANLGVARAYKELHQPGRAIERYRHAMTINPDSVSALIDYAMLKRFEPGEPEMDRMREILAGRGPALSDKRRAALLLAFAKVNQDIGNYRESCDNYLLGKEVARKIAPFSLDDDRRYAERARAVFDAATISEGRRQGIVGNSPIFVVGLPRCGKTSVAQLIGLHPRTSAEPEIVGLGWLVRNLIPRDADAPFDVDRARQTFLRPRDDAGAGAGADAAAPGSGGDAAPRIKVSSSPENFWALGAIDIMFPDARIIHCRRDPLSHCLAIFKSNFLSPKMGFCHSIEQTIEYMNIYNEMMAYWPTVLQSPIHDVNYADLVKQGRAGVEALFEACGLDLADVKDPLPELALGTSYDNGLFSYEQEAPAASRAHEGPNRDRGLIEAFCDRVPALRDFAASAR